MSEYNGWTNYETWLVNLWIDNDQDEQEYWLERATSLLDTNYPLMHLADELANSHKEKATDIASNSVFSDLLQSSLQVVNWREIAQSMLDDIEELAA